jgi:2-desacetyl-2-hydroxyethyl bacteriochlorophyllide A dehydrogenase
MRAAFFTNGRFEIRAVDRPVPAADEILIDVIACGVCGSDVHFYGGDVPAPTVCPGHEIAGRVARGSAHATLPEGTPVVVEPLRSCGSCGRCRGGEPNLCPRLRILGTHLPGGFADAVIVPVSSVHRVPSDLDLDLAVLVEPLAVAVHGVGLAGADRQGRDALVLGGGAIGLLTAFVAGRAGWRVTLAARHEHQRRAAQRLGAARVTEADRGSVLAAAEEPPDVAFEAVGGRSDTVDLALRAVRPGGAIVTLGLFTAPIALPPLRFLAKEVSIVASMMYSRRPPVADFAAAIELLSAGRRDLATLITHRVPLEAIDDGFAAASDKRSGAIKVRVDVR